MKTLRQALEDYLTLRQAMGFKLSEARTLLPQFVDFLDHHGATFITTEWAMEWATQPRHIQPAGGASRLRSVRGFARYHIAIDPRTAIPPPALLPYRPQRRSPYLYSDAEIIQLMKAASRLPSATGLRAHTYTTVFGLLVVTGRRISELVGLDQNDCDLDDGLLTIRHSKFGKSRCLPLHLTTQQALSQYVKRRDHIYSIPKSPSFLSPSTGCDCPLARSEPRLCNARARSACGARATAMGHACTIFATASPCNRWCAGTKRMAMSNVICTSSRRTSVMSRSATRTGT